MLSGTTLVAVITSVTSGGMATFLVYLLGRRSQRHKDEVAEEAQHIVNAVAVKTAEQKTIDQLMTRVDKLELWQERAAIKMEALSSDKSRLEAEKYQLVQRVAEFEATIRKMEQDASMSAVTISDLQNRLTEAQTKLRSTEAQLISLQAMDYHHNSVQLDPDN